MVSLKKGDKVFFGKLGHRGFNYPTSDSELLLFDVNAEKGVDYLDFWQIRSISGILCQVFHIDLDPRQPAG